MKLKRFLLPILAWSGLMLTSCHCEHEKFTGYLSSLQVGNVVCSDGNILSIDKFRQSGKEPIAIVSMLTVVQMQIISVMQFTFMIWNRWLLLIVLVLIRVLLHH